MTVGAHCHHCDADQAVVPILDYEKDRFLYVCVHCGWWGHDPLRMDFPPTDEIASRLAQKGGTTLRFRRR
jgi:hypothetical protein